uniref:Uncharacterized protein n=1 Tax=Anguilla anguilla TaxID=7936 RepID=A0A0E9XXA2_ANGAN
MHIFNFYFCIYLQISGVCITC